MKNDSENQNSDKLHQSAVETTPFDRPTLSTSTSASVEMPQDAAVLDSNALGSTFGERIAPDEPQEEANTSLPDNIRIAGALFISHGICLAANGFLWGRDHGDNNSILRGFLWFGATFFVAGGLFERRVWAWWFATLIGGGTGMVNLLSIIGSALSRSLLHDEPLTTNFVPPIIAVAAFIMLLSTSLLLTASTKAAFGITKENPTGLF